MGDDMFESDVTRLLSDIRMGDEAARDGLFSTVYAELRQIASRQMRSEPAGHTLQTTALVHEAYMRLTQGKRLDTIENRRHFFGAASLMMKRILIDHARRRRSLRRNPQGDRLLLDAVLDQIETTHKVDLIDLSDALDELAVMNKRQSEIVDLRFFGGLNVADVAEQLGVSVSLVEKDFAAARAWLNLRLE
ncbi:MAG TPA: ECF-type sigma factor [Phycisphaerae bacterium]|nr:ECF-type sigma factor [Phycisphaerae bacterium]